MTTIRKGELIPERLKRCPAKWCRRKMSYVRDTGDFVTLKCDNPKHKDGGFVHLEYEREKNGF